jgi:hypothetical protein
MAAGSEAMSVTNAIGSARAPALLSALESAHRQIEASFVEMEDVASADSPDHERVGLARLRVGQANLARRRIVTKLLSHLTAVITVDARDALREHLRRDEDHSQKVSALIREWTPKAVIRDWNGYREASRAIRSGIQHIIATEKTLLYPLLKPGGAKSESA